MNEQEQLYNLFIKKTNDELKEIINSEDEYTEIAKKVAISILEKERGIELEEKKVLEAALVSVSTNDTKNSNNYIMFMLCFITLLFLISIIINALLYSKVSKNYSDSDSNILDIPIINKYYEGTGDYFGTFFYFYNDNTYRAITSSGNSILYGTYIIDKNSLMIFVSSEFLAAVIIENGDKIMIGDNALIVTHNNKIIEVFKDVLNIQ